MMSTPPRERSDQRFLSPHQLVVEHDRGELGDLEPLASSIRVNGILNPITARPGPNDTFIVVAGRRRREAAIMAGEEEVPVIVRQEVDATRAIILALTENLERRDLSPAEEAHQFQALVDLGLTVPQVAASVQRNARYVKNRLQLLQLPDKLQGQVHLGSGESGLRLEEALELTRLPDPDSMLAVADQYAQKMGRMDWLVESALKHLGRERARQAVLDLLERNQVQLVMEGAPAWPVGLGDHFGPHLPISADDHAGFECHGARVLEDGTVQYLCLNPGNHLDEGAPDLQEAAARIIGTWEGSEGGEAESAEAKRQRLFERLCRRVVKGQTPARERAISHLVNRRVSFTKIGVFLALQLAESAPLAAQELATELTGITDLDTEEHVWRWAYAVALAVGELPLRQWPTRRYMEDEDRHLALRALAHLATASATEPYLAEPEEELAVGSIWEDEAIARRSVKGGYREPVNGVPDPYRSRRRRPRAEVTEDEPGHSDGPDQSIPVDKPDQPDDPNPAAPTFMQDRSTDE